MSTENPVAQRLVNDARKKTARQGSPLLARIALGISVLALISTPFLLYGYPLVWAVGGAAVITGGIAVQRSVSKKTAWAACIIGFVAICAGTFIYTLLISRFG
jgi:uncharacterized membrane protein HdeD (DUF308 family)